MRSVLEDAAIDLRDLSFLCPHGSGSKKGDRSELASIRDLCEERGSDIPITGLKAYTGHLGAASDLAEVIFCLRSVREGMIPATLHFREADREFRGLRISGKHEPCERGPFLSLSYGIGGQSSAVVVEVP
jgi:3-oxoacyl-[acyl-carrier-protein] synthase II